MMLQDHILSAEAGIYAEAPDPLGISFVTSELFHGTVAECLGELARYASPRRASAYIETVDGAIHLDPDDIEAVLAEPGAAKAA